MEKIPFEIPYNRTESHRPMFADIINPITMFRNYCRIIIRNLRKNKLYTLINMIGLGVGIAAITWGYQNYRFSFSYDDFHKNRDIIFRVLIKVAGSDDLKGTCPAPLAIAAKN